MPGRCKSLNLPLLVQVASLQEMLPGMVSTFFMSYIQEDDSPPEHASGPQPMQTDQLQNRMTSQTDAAVTVTQAAGVPAHKLAMHTTASSAVAVPSTGCSDQEPQLHVPKIAFLYKCVLTSCGCSHDDQIAGIVWRHFGMQCPDLTQALLLLTRLTHTGGHDGPAA